MDATPSTDAHVDDLSGPAHAVLAEVTFSWVETAEGSPSTEHATAVILHVAPDMLVLEAIDPRRKLPPLSTLLTVVGANQQFSGRLAEHGRSGRFLVAIGNRPVRRSVRLRVSLPGTLRSPLLDEPRQIEIVDLTTGGARVRGVELPVDAQVSLDFTPPGRDESVTVRARVAHGTQGGTQPWVGLLFRLVAMRGGR